MTLTFAALILFFPCFFMLGGLITDTYSMFSIGLCLGIIWLILGYGMIGTTCTSPTYTPVTIDVPILSVVETPSHEFILFLGNGQEHRITTLKYSPLKTAKSIKFITGRKNMYGGLLSDTIDLDASLEACNNTSIEEPLN